MNSATAAHWQSVGTASPASPRLLAGCLLASVMAHAVLLAALPGWWHSTAPEVPAPIEMVLMPAAAPAAAPALASSPAVKPRPTAPFARSVAAAPASTETAVSVSSAEAILPAAVAAAHPSIASSAVPAAARAAPVTTPAVNAAYLRNPPPRYPPAARRSGDQGTVLLRVLVSADGAAAQVELDRSSGSSLLDGAALDAVRGWRFVPARRGAQHVDDWVQVPVVFRLES